jgi:hypothetical protein
VGGAGSAQSCETGESGSPIVGLGNSDRRRGSNGLNRSEIQIVQTKSKVSNLTDHKSAFLGLEKLK